MILQVKDICIHFSDCSEGLIDNIILYANVDSRLPHQPVWLKAYRGVGLDSLQYKFAKCTIDSWSVTEKRKYVQVARSLYS